MIYNFEINTRSSKFCRTNWTSFCVPLDQEIRCVLEVYRDYSRSARMHFLLLMETLRTAANQFLLQSLDASFHAGCDWVLAFKLCEYAKQKKHKCMCVQYCTHVVRILQCTSAPSATSFPSANRLHLNQPQNLSSSFWISCQKKATLIPVLVETLNS